MSRKLRPSAFRMDQLGPRLKAFLNEQATVRLAQLGHSDAMIVDAKREAWWWLQARSQAMSRRSRLFAGRAVVWTAPGRAELLPVEVAGAGKGEVTVEIMSSTVSPGTERAQYLRLPNARVDLPYRPGYSAAGVVVASGAAEFEPGALVAVRNVPHMSVATVPARSVHAVPSGVPPEAAAMLQLGIICGQGVRRAALRPNEPVCIVGAGLIGLLAQRLAAAAGAGPVTVVARSRDKEAVALAGGADRFLLAAEDATEIGALSAPVVIDATGDPTALSLAVEAAGPNARVLLLGSSRGVTNDVPVAAIRAKGLRVVGAHIGTLRHESTHNGLDVFKREGDAFLRLLAAGRVQVIDLVDIAVDPREADAFYRRLARGRDIVGARFDWEALPADERIGSSRFVQFPDLRGRGTDFRRRPLGAGASNGRATRSEDADPFEGAAGMLRVGLLGCGDVAVQNAAAIQRAPNVALTACYDPVGSLAEDLAQAHGAVASPTSNALLARDDVDAVLLSVPHHLHLPLGAEVAAAGKHIIVEKPLANDFVAAAELVSAAERKGVVLSVCFPHRYQPNAVAARRLIADGVLGTFGGAMLTFFMDKPASYWVSGFSGRAHSSWRGSRDKAGGGVLIMNLSHYIDLLRHLTGAEADLVTAQEQTSEAGAEVEDAVSVSVRYVGGALGSLVACTALRGSTTESALRLWGSHGQIAIEPEARVYTLRALDGLRTNRWQTFAELPPRNARAVYFSRLATALHRGEPPEVSGRDGLAVQAVIEAAYRSNRDGVSVDAGALLDEVAPLPSPIEIGRATS
jgi:predicted dehydrogenase/threonine dehydrogenase-like Zn-dependent dehydrogenase